MSESVEQRLERGAGRLEPGDVEGHFALARDLTEAGYSPEALAAVQSALRLSPNNADLHAWHGYHHLARQAREDADRNGAGNGRAADEAAVAAFQRAADLDPTNTYALSYLGRLHWRLGDRHKAVKALEASVAAGAVDFDTHSRLAQYQGRMLHLRDMARTLKALNALPDSPERDEHYKHVHRVAARAEVGLVAVGCTAACLAAFLAAFLVWRRRRG